MESLRRILESHSAKQFRPFANHTALASGPPWRLTLPTPNPRAANSLTFTSHYTAVRYYTDLPEPQNKCREDIYELVDTLLGTKQIHLAS